MSIIPMSDMKDYHIPKFVDEEEVLQPKYRRPLERPKKGRHKQLRETMSSNTYSCGKCGCTGHNRQTCNFFLKNN